MNKHTVAAGRRLSLAPWGVLGTVVLMAACASTPVPREEMALADSAVTRVSGSPRVLSAAPLELQSAKDKLQRARQALDKGNNVEARRLAEQARADARLAEARAAESRSSESLKEVQDGIDALQKELGRR